MSEQNFGSTSQSQPEQGTADCCRKVSHLCELTIRTCCRHRINRINNSKLSVWLHRIIEFKSSSSCQKYLSPLFFKTHFYASIGLWIWVPSFPVVRNSLSATDLAKQHILFYPSPQKMEMGTFAMEIGKIECIDSRPNGDGYFIMFGDG